VLPREGLGAAAWVLVLLLVLMLVLLVGLPCKEGSEMQ
jgi:hypothetical protein